MESKRFFFLVNQMQCLQATAVQFPERWRFYSHLAGNGSRRGQLVPWLAWGFLKHNCPLCAATEVFLHNHLEPRKARFFFDSMKGGLASKIRPHRPVMMMKLNLSFAGMSCLSSTLTRRKSWKPSFKHSFNFWVRFLEDRWDPSWPRYCFFPATDRAGQRIAVEGPSVRDSV